MFFKIPINDFFQAFAAGADIKEMQNKTMAENYTTGFLGNHGIIIKIDKIIDVEYIQSMNKNFR